MNTISCVRVGSALVLLVVGLLACSTPTRKATPPESSQQLSPAEYEEVRSVVVSYLECDECESGEEQALKKLGGKALPTLKAILEGGPSPARLAEYEAGLKRTYRQLRDYAGTHPESQMAMNEDEYVATYLSNYRAQYAIRAASGLAVIGGDDARAALERAAGRSDLRPDVAREVRRLLASTR